MDIQIENAVIDEDKKIQSVTISGEIDVYSSPKVKELLNSIIEDGYNKLYIDLENVRYIDSTGLGVLIGALKKVRENDGSILLVCTNPQIRKIFNITGLVKIFDLLDTPEEALAKLSA